MSTPRFGRAERERFLRRLWALDAKLVKAGFSPISPWWRKHLRRYVLSGNRRWLVRAGRRAGKSTTMARFSVAWWLFGVWHVPPGDIGVVAYVSVSKDEALARLRLVEALLQALGIEYKRRDDELEVEAQQGATRPVLFKVFACTLKAVAGFTSIFILLDECALWTSDKSSANPSGEVVAMLGPTSATQKWAPLVGVSTPLGHADWHATSIDQGEDDEQGKPLQTISIGATWECNPTLSEADTHALEPDIKVWRRAYAAIPSETVSDALDADDLAACFGRALPENIGQWAIPTDASSLMGDEFAWLVAGVTPNQELVITEADAFESDRLRTVTMSDVCDHIADIAKARGARQIFGDQREAASLDSMFSERNLRFTSFAWTDTTKDDALQLLRRLMRERRLYLPDHPTLRRELETMRTRLLPSGRIRIETTGLDFASALLTLLHAVLADEYQLRQYAAEPIVSHTGTSRWSTYSDRFGGRGFG